MSFGLFKFLREQLQFLILVLIWLLSGMYGGPAVYGVIPLSMLLLKRRKMHLELLLGFFLILILSDSRQPVFGFAANVKDIYLLLLGVMLFIDRATFSPLDRIFFRFLPFLIIALFSLIFSTVFLVSVQKTVSYGLLLLVVPNYIVSAWKDRGATALTTLVWWGVSVLLAGILLRFTSPNFVTLEGRFTGILGNPNGLGLFCLVFFILYSIIREMNKDSFSRFDWIFIYFIIFLSIMLCGSRNALLTTLIFLLFRAFYKLSPYIGFVLLLVFIVLYQLVVSNAESIIVSLGLEQYFRLETLETGSGRLIAWQFGWEWITKSPVFGSGIGFTDDLYHRYYEYLSILGHQGNAHNSYITFWLDTGIIGLLAYLIAAFATFITGSRRTRSALPALYAILFSAFFESWLTASLNPFTIQFVLIMTLIASPVFVKSNTPGTESLLPDQLSEAPNPQPDGSPA